MYASNVYELHPRRKKKGTKKIIIGINIHNSSYPHCVSQQGKGDVCYLSQIRPAIPKVEMSCIPEMGTRVAEWSLSSLAWWIPGGGPTES